MSILSSRTAQLTLPTSTDTLVGRNTTDTLTNKSVLDSTFKILDNFDQTARVYFNLANSPSTDTILQITSTTLRNIFFPDATTHLVGDDTTQTLTNKTLSSTGNTITITSGSLSNTNINSVVNQPLLTSSNIQFNTIGIGTVATSSQLQFSNSVLNRKIVLYDGGSNNDHQFYGLGVNGATFRFQADQTNTDYIFYAATSSTTSNELCRIRGNYEFWYCGGKIKEYTASGSVNSATPATALTIAVPTNTSITIETNCVGYSTAGTNINKSLIRRLTARVTNVAGTVTVGGSVENYTNNDGGLNSVSISHVASTTNVLVNVTGIASDTISYTVITKVYYL